MSSDTKNSGSGSGPTSSGEAEKRARKDYDKALDPAVADADLTEDEYLRRQGERAKLAIVHTAAAMKAKLWAGTKQAGSSAAASKADVLKQHPWAVVGGAAAVGFAGAVLLSPNKVRKLRGRLDKLEKRLKKHEKSVEVIYAAPDEPPSADKKTTKTAAKASIMSSLGAIALREGLKAAQPYVLNTLGSLLHAAKGDRAGHPDETGHPNPEAGEGEAVGAGVGTASERLDPRI